MSGGAVPENEAHVSTQAAKAVNSVTVVGEFPEAEAMAAMTDPTPRKGIMSMISEAPTVDTFVEAEFDLRC